MTSSSVIRCTIEIGLVLVPSEGAERGRGYGTFRAGLIDRLGWEGAIDFWSRLVNLREDSF